MTKTMVELDWDAVSNIIVEELKKDLDYLNDDVMMYSINPKKEAKKKKKLRKALITVLTYYGAYNEASTDEC
jgi:hypothetical protein